jgi:hypothetical protein
MSRSPCPIVLSLIIQDAETGTISLADGTSHSADLIIGADGVHVSCIVLSRTYESRLIIYQVKDSRSYCSQRGVHKALRPERLPVYQYSSIS